MDELLSLKWNNHCSTFLQVLGVVRNKQKYTDVTLACSGKFYGAHKMVLSTCSDYFKEIFDQSDAGKSLVIVLKDINVIDLELLLDYMYLGEVSVKQTDLSSLLKAAECLQIKGLAVSDDEDIQKTAPVQSKKQTSPVSRRKRKLQGSDQDDNDSYHSSRSSKKATKQNAVETVHIFEEIPIKEIEPTLIKEEEIPEEPEIVDDVYKEEYSNIEDITEEIPSVPPEEVLESQEELQESLAMETTIEEDSFSSFQGEPSEWPNEDSSLNYPSSSDYGPPETSGQQTPAEKKSGSYFGSKMGRKKHYKSLQMKKKILGEMKAGVPIASLMVEYGVGRTTLYDWRRDMAKIEKDASVVSKPGSTRFYKSGYFSEIEDDLSLWIQERQKNRVILSNAIIQAKAKQLYENLPESSHKAKLPFVASIGWVARFLKRHGHHIGAVKADVTETEKFWEISPEVKDPFAHHIFTTDDESGTLLEANEDEHT